jgi:hypothetical protein
VVKGFVWWYLLGATALLRSHGGLAVLVFVSGNARGVESGRSQMRPRQRERTCIHLPANVLYCDCTSASES